MAAAVKMVPQDDNTTTADSVAVVEKEVRGGGGSAREPRVVLPVSPVLKIPLKLPQGLDEDDDLLAGVVLERKPLKDGMVLKGKRTWVSQKRYTALLDKLKAANFYIDSLTGGFAVVEANGMPQVFVKEQAVKRWLLHEGYFFGRPPSYLPLYDFLDREVSLRYVKDIRWSDSEVDDGSTTLTTRARFKWDKQYDTRDEETYCLRFFWDVVKCISGDVNENSMYLVRYLASLFQHPHSIMGVAIILTGEQGCGKDSFLALLARLAGPFAGRCSGFRSLFSPHSTTAQDKVLTWVEEGDDLATCETARVNTLITSSKILLNQKYCPERLASNSSAFFVSANLPRPVPKGAGERRWVLLPSSVRHKKEVSFWRSWKDKILDDDRAVHTIGRWLLEYGVVGFEARERLSDLSYSSVVLEEELRPLIVDFYDQSTRTGAHPASTWLADYKGFVLERKLDIPVELIGPAAPQWFGTHFLSIALRRGLISKVQSKYRRCLTAVQTSPGRGGADGDGADGGGAAAEGGAAPAKRLRTLIAVKEAPSVRLQRLAQQIAGSDDEAEGEAAAAPAAAPIREVPSQRMQRLHDSLQEYGTDDDDEDMLRAQEQFENDKEALKFLEEGGQPLPE